MKKTWLRQLSILLILLFVPLEFSGCTINASSKRWSNSYLDLFDTVTEIVGYEKDQAAFDKVCLDVYGLLEEYHRLTDIYQSYPGVNNLYTVNEHAGKEPVKVEKKLMDFLLFSLDVYEVTGGMTDISLGSVLRIWHHYREEAGKDPSLAKVPAMEELTEAKTHAGMDKLKIDRENSTVFLTDPEASLDVGALAKGYAAEQAARFLEEQGITGYTLNLGGNIRTVGKKPGGADWIAAIENPDKQSEERYLCRVALSDISLVTSGNYQRYYMCDGVRYHHIIHPEHLFPQNTFLSVSVLIPDSGAGDALSTALFNLTLEEGKALADRIGAEVLWVMADGRMEMTEGFGQYFVRE